MRYPEAYLIKQAVTVERLAAIAKSHGIPLLGDWRYAARLLGRQASPAGKAHYMHEAGFLRPAEREKMKYKARQLGRKFREKLIEYDVRGGEPRYAIGTRFQVYSPTQVYKRVQRSVHTHPVRLSKQHMGRKRSLRMALGRANPYFGKFVSVVPSGSDVLAARTVAGRKRKIPLSSAFEYLERLKGPMNVPWSAGDLASVRGAPARSVHVIWNPAKELQSVQRKGTGLKPSRIYFKGPSA